MKQMQEFEIIEHVAGVPVLRTAPGLKSLKDAWLFNKTVFQLHPEWRYFLRRSFAEELELDKQRCGPAEGELYIIVCNVDGKRWVQTGFIRPEPGSDSDVSACMQIQLEIELHAFFLDQLEASPLTEEVKL